MKYLLPALLLLSSVIYPQEKYYTFSELRGMEDNNGVTQLFYRKFTSANDTNNNSFYRYNTQTEEENLFLEEEFADGPPSIYANDFDFWNNDPAEYITLQTLCGFECLSIIKTNETTVTLDYLQSPGNKIEISAFDDSLIYAGIPFLVKSTDGGNSWAVDSFNINFVSSSPFNENEFYALDNSGKLLKTINSGNSYYVVDTSLSYNNSKIYYDMESTYIYKLTLSYNIYQLSVSNNSGEPFSWSVKYQSENEIFISVDYSNSGHIYLADGRFIYRSTDYGNTFTLFKEFDKKLVGIYKKPGSDKLYAATKYKLMEIENDTIKILKQLKLDPEIFSYYPLAVGNKWVYHWSSWDGFPYYSEGTAVTEIFKDTVLSNGKKYFKVKRLYYNEIDYERIDSTNGNVLRFKDSVDIVIDDLTAEPGDTLFLYNRFLEEKDTYTIVEENEKLILPWGDSVNAKIFDYSFLISFGYSLSKKYGITHVRNGYDFGVTNYNLKGCIIDGVVYGDTSFVVGVEDEENLPLKFSLSQNYPNPFNPTTKIKFTIPTSPLLTKERGRGEVVSLKIYDVLGNEIATLVNEEKPAGEYEVEFNGSGLSSGVYFYRLTFAEFSKSNKMILIK